MDLLQFARFNPRWEISLRVRDNEGHIMVSCAAGSYGRRWYGQPDLEKALRDAREYLEALPDAKQKR